MLSGVGTGGFPIRANAPEAQAWFDYGMKLAHAFNHAGRDRRVRGGLPSRSGLRHVRLGRGLGAGADDQLRHRRGGEASAAAGIADRAAILGEDEREKKRALIAALRAALRRHGAARARNKAFAKAMDGSSARYPADDEIAVMTADAWMIADPTTVRGMDAGDGRA